MKCPNCANRVIDISFNYEGMTEDVIKECSLCGLVWTIKNKKIRILKDKTQ